MWRAFRAVAMIHPIILWKEKQKVERDEEKMKVD